MKQDRSDRHHSNCKSHDFAPANPEKVLQKKLSNMFEKLPQALNKAVEIQKNCSFSKIFQKYGPTS